MALYPSVDDLVPFQVPNTIEDSATNFTWMDVPLGEMGRFEMITVFTASFIFEFHFEMTFYA